MPFNIRSKTDLFWTYFKLINWAGIKISNHQNGTVRSNFRLILFHAVFSVFMHKKTPEKIDISKYFNVLCNVDGYFILPYSVKID